MKEYTINVRDPNIVEGIYSAIFKGYSKLWVVEPLNDSNCVTGSDECLVRERP